MARPSAFRALLSSRYVPATSRTPRTSRVALLPLAEPVVPLTANGGVDPFSNGAPGKSPRYPLAVRRSIRVTRRILAASEIRRAKSHEVDSEVTERSNRTRVERQRRRKSRKRKRERERTGMRKWRSSLSVPRGLRCGRSFRPL